MASSASRGEGGVAGRCGAVALQNHPRLGSPRPDLERARHLYIHVPFCGRRCSYCDFAIAVRRETPVAEYLRALRAELRQYRDRGSVLDTVYFGGGTPSRLGGAGIAGALGAVREVAEIAGDAEITIEVNPDDVSERDVARWVGAGVNRVSLGVQSFDEGVLRWMHRTHSVGQIFEAVRVIREGGVGNISADLIFSLPDFLERDWRRDLELVLGLGVEHLSLYGLTVEEHTPLGRWRERGAVREASEEVYEREFLAAHEMLEGAGYQHYEVSNYWKGGRWSRHNSAYWSGVPYVGVGPSAHGFDGAVRRWNVDAYVEWARRLERGESVLGGEELLTVESRAVERIYLGLRTVRGLEATPSELAIAERWVSEGWAKIVGRTIVLEASGWLRLDALAASLTLAGSA